MECINYVDIMKIIETTTRYNFQWPPSALVLKIHKRIIKLLYISRTNGLCGSISDIMEFIRKRRFCYADDILWELRMISKFSVKWLTLDTYMYKSIFISIWMLFWISMLIKNVHKFFKWICADTFEKKKNLFNFCLLKEQNNLYNLLSFFFWWRWGCAIAVRF